MSGARLFPICAAMTCINAWVSLAFSLALVSGQHASDTGALYALARSLPLAVAALVVGAGRSYRGVAIMGMLLTAIQLCDALVGFRSHDLMKTVGPAILAILTFLPMCGIVREVRKPVSG